MNKDFNLICVTNIERIIFFLAYHSEWQNFFLAYHSGWLNEEYYCSKHGKMAGLAWDGLMPKLTHIHIRNYLSRTKMEWDSIDLDQVPELLIVNVLMLTQYMYCVFIVAYFIFIALILMIPEINFRPSLKRM